MHTYRRIAEFVKAHAAPLQELHEIAESELDLQQRSPTKQTEHTNNARRSVKATSCFVT
jgi:hypothetical protein